ncbi:hypothetical protein PMAYCL1PPCAC_10903, partial [Pristionchus mayeri]
MSIQKHVHAFLDSSVLPTVMVVVRCLMNDCGNGMMDSYMSSNYCSSYWMIMRVMVVMMMMRCNGCSSDSPDGH